MLRILHDTKIDFIRLWKITTVVTLLFIIPGLLFLAVSGYKYSIEFTGGTLMQVRFAKAPNVADVRSTLDNAGIKGAEIAQFGTDLDYVIRAQDPRSVAQQTRGAESVAGKIEEALTAKFGQSAYTVQRTETVGPKVGGELRTKAFYAILISFVATLAYLAWRFEWRFGVAAVIAADLFLVGSGLCGQAQGMTELVRGDDTRPWQPPPRFVPKSGRRAPSCALPRRESGLPGSV